MTIRVSRDLVIPPNLDWLQDEAAQRALEAAYASGAFGVASDAAVSAQDAQLAYVAQRVLEMTGEYIVWIEEGEDDLGMDWYQHPVGRAALEAMQEEDCHKVTSQALFSALPTKEDN